MEKTLKRFSIGIALAAMLTTAANASIITYDWVTDSSAYTAYGEVTYDNVSGLITSYDWNVLDTSWNIHDTLIWPTTAATILTDGHLVLGGNAQSYPSAGWYPLTTFGWFQEDTTGPQENLFYGPGFTQIRGDWVPVPEPTTMIAGALLLLPFGASTLRILRKTRKA